MYANIQKWGNSHGIRLSKTVLEMANLSENDKVEIRLENNNLVLIPIKKQLTLKERIADYDGDYVCTEWNTGEPRGSEVL